MRAKSCACNWEYVGETLGSVWFRGSLQRFVAVRPDRSVLGATFRSRTGAVLGLVMDARRREGVAGALYLDTDAAKGWADVLELDPKRAVASRSGAGSSAPDGFGRSLVAMIRRGGIFGT